MSSDCGKYRIIVGVESENGVMPKNPFREKMRGENIPERPMPLRQWTEIQEMLPAQGRESGFFLPKNQPDLPKPDRQADDLCAKHA